MGIGFINGQLLLREQAVRPFSGCVLQLGRQDMGWKPHGQQMNDEQFFQWLGFAEVYSCDVSDYEKPTFLVDLNEPLTIRSPLQDEYDLVYDGGTLEHVFHLPHALANIHDLLKVGGRVIHANPVANYVDHGFYQFSPTFFWDYYTANDYEINGCWLVASRQREEDRPELYEYQAGCLDELKRDGLRSIVPGADIWDSFFVATKGARSTCGVIPQQRACKKIWAQDKTARPPFHYRGVLGEGS